MITLTVKSWFKQFVPFSQLRTSADNAVITNGIPKSGTYFLNKCIEHLDKWMNIGFHIIPNEVYTVPKQGDFIYSGCLTHFSVKRLRNGQFAAAHMPWSKEAENAIGGITPKRRIKHVLIYRDPRDTLVSYMRFVTYSPTYVRTAAARAKKKFLQEEFDNDTDRLTYIIKEKTDNYSIKFDHLKYAPWLQSNHCLAISFEELYNEFTNMKKNGLGDTLTGLFNYLKIDINTIDPLALYHNVFGKSLTASDLKNKIGQYKHYFTQRHYDMIDNADFRKALDTFGYKW